MTHTERLNRDRAQDWIDQEHHKTGHSPLCGNCVCAALAAAVQAKADEITRAAYDWEGDIASFRTWLRHHAADIPEAPR